MAVLTLPLTAAPPSVHAGYARCAAESAHPQLWQGLVSGWVPAIHSSIQPIRDVVSGYDLPLLAGATAATVVAGDYGFAARSDSSTANWELTGVNSTPLAFGTTFSVLVVVRPTAGNNFDRVFLNSQTSGTDGVELAVISNVWTLIIGRSGTPTRVKSNTLVQNEWRVFVGTVDGTTLVLWEDGVPYTTSGSGTLSGVGNDRLRIVTPSASFDVATVLYYDRILSSGEIGQLTIDPLAPFRLRSVMVAYPGTPTGSILLENGDRLILESDSANNGHWLVTGDDPGTIGANNVWTKT